MDKSVNTKEKVDFHTFLSKKFQDQEAKFEEKLKTK